MDSRMPSTLARRPLGLGLASLLLSGCVPPARAQRSLFGAAGGVVVPDFADLAEQVLPSVVNIAVTGEQRSEIPIPPELRGTPFERQFRERFRGRRQETVGAGSGFVIDPAGFVVTNNHVVGSASRVVVSLQDGSEHPARVVGTDELTDLALLRIETGRQLPAVPWGSSTRARVGSWVMAAGNPFGLGGSVTTGIISARGREIGAGPFDDFIQTDAAINPGNSGGPVFNMAGEVIGISTAIYSPSGANAGIGFATPSDLARPVVEQLRREGRVERGWLGVSVQDVVPEEARSAGASGARRGVLVAGVERNSPAGRAGLRQGDLVIAMNGEPISTSRALVRNVAALPPGQSMRLTVLREGRERELQVQVGRRPTTPGQG